MGARRGRGEGSVEQLPDGRWRAILSLGVEWVPDPDNPGLKKEKRKRRKFYGKTKTEALRKLREAQQQASAGHLADDPRLTFGQWTDKWLSLKESSVENSTYCRYRSVAKSFLKPKLGDVPLVKLGTVHVEDLYAWMKKEGHSGCERRRAGAYLATILRAAIKRGLCVRNPVADVPMPKAEPSEFKVWSLHQVKTFLEACNGNRLEALFWLHIDAGPRPGELLGLHWPEVDLDRGAVSFIRSLESLNGVVALKDTKTDAGRRTVAITASTVEAMRRHRDRQAGAGMDVQDGLVFPNGQGTFLRHRTYYSHYFVPMLKKSGVTPIPPYNLRHTCAVLLLTNGVNIKVVSERLGHTSVRIILDHYARFMPGMQQMAAETMERLLSPSSPPEEGKGKRR